MNYVLAKSVNIAKWSSNSKEATDLTNLIGKMMVLDYEPCNMVHHKEFRRFLETQFPQYQIPARTIFSRTIIPQLYKREVDRVKAEIAADLAEGSYVLFIY